METKNTQLRFVKFFFSFHWNENPADNIVMLTSEVTLN